MDEYSHRSQGELAFFCPLALFLWEYHKQSSDPCREFEVSLACSTLCVYSYTNFCSHAHSSTAATDTPISNKDCATCLDENSRNSSSCNTSKRNGHRRDRHFTSDNDTKNRCHTRPGHERSRHHASSDIPGSQCSLIPAQWSTALACMEAANQPAQGRTARHLSQHSDFSMDE